MNDQETVQVGLTRPIAIMYLSFGMAGLIATMLQARLAGVRLVWQYDLWFPALLVLSSIGTLRRTRWGRWTAYLWSAFFLAGVPIGTIFGTLMIRHLTKHRAAFSRWY